MTGNKEATTPAPADAGFDPPSRYGRNVQLLRMMGLAVTIGVLGALAVLGFHQLLLALETRLYGSNQGLVADAMRLPPGIRAIVPALGGLAAGLLLQYLLGRGKGQAGADYMEAISAGSDIPVRSSLLKSLASAATVVSGGSIGREGSMVQLAALCGSLSGKILHLSADERRFAVACGAAAGLAGAYNTPIAGALFVAEIVLGGFSVGSFGPLLLAAAIADSVVRHVSSVGPIFAASPGTLQSVPELLLVVATGIAAGLLGPLFIGALESRAPVSGCAQCSAVAEDDTRRAGGRRAFGDPPRSVGQRLLGGELIAAPAVAVAERAADPGAEGRRHGADFGFGGGWRRVHAYAVRRRGAGHAGGQRGAADAARRVDDGIHAGRHECVPCRRHPRAADRGGDGQRNDRRLRPGARAGAGQPGRLLRVIGAASGIDIRRLDPAEPPHAEHAVDSFLMGGKGGKRFGLASTQRYVCRRARVMGSAFTRPNFFLSSRPSFFTQPQPPDVMAGIALRMLDQVLLVVFLGAPEFPERHDLGYYLGVPFA